MSIDERKRSLASLHYALIYHLRAVFCMGIFLAFLLVARTNVSLINCCVSLRTVVNRKLLRESEFRLFFDRGT